MTDIAVLSTSIDHGDTWVDDNVGTSPGPVGGMDVVKIGDYCVAAAINQAMVESAIGGSFVSYGVDGATASVQPTLVQYPWYVFDSDIDTNYTPPYDFILGASALTSSECLWLVLGAGGRDNITPSGVTSVSGPECSTTWKGKRGGFLLMKSGVQHLYTSTTLGGANTMTDRGAVDANAVYIRTRRRSGSGIQLFFVADTDLGMSTDFGVTVVYKPTPSAGPLLGVEPFG